MAGLIHKFDRFNNPPGNTVQIQNFFFVSFLPNRRPSFDHNTFTVQLYKLTLYIYIRLL